MLLWRVEAELSWAMQPMRMMAAESVTDAVTGIPTKGLVSVPHPGGASDCL